MTEYDKRQTEAVARRLLEQRMYEPLSRRQFVRRFGGAFVVTGLGANLLAACGGGDDDKEAQDAVREFIRATNERDADTFCNEAITDDFREQFTAAKGDSARKICEQQLKSSKTPRLQLVHIVKTEVDGDEAEVTADMRTQGQPLKQVFHLKKEHGDWGVAGGSGP